MFEKINIPNLLGTSKKTDLRLSSHLTDSLEDADYIVVGFPDDEGIQNNGGRPGASSAPNSIRNYFYKFTPPVFKDEKTFKVYDYGNLKIEKSLEERHSTAISFLERLLDQQKKIISFGGGHDYGYVDGKAFLNFCSDTPKKPIIINFDAHLDVRNLDHGITSGTPFYRLLEDDNFHFVEIGIQEQCNSKNHLNYLKTKDAHCLSLDELYPFAKFNFDVFKNLFDTLDTYGAPCFLSVDIDAFSNAFAPGCSQSFATGLEAKDFFLMFNFLIEKFKVYSLGIYEVSPPLDFDNKTSKLAAQIAYKFIYA